MNKLKKLWKSKKYSLFLGFFNIAGGIILLGKAENGFNFDIILGFIILTMGCLILANEFG